MKKTKYKLTRESDEQGTIFYFIYKNGEVVSCFASGDERLARDSYDAIINNRAKPINETLKSDEI